MDPPRFHDQTFWYANEYIVRYIIYTLVIFSSFSSTVYTTNIHINKLYTLDVKI